MSSQHVSVHFLWIVLHFELLPSPSSDCAPYLDNPQRRQAARSFDQELSFKKYACCFDRISVRIYSLRCGYAYSLCTTE